jgi:hypothetical protein
MAVNDFVRRLIEVEVRLGFLYIPAHGIEMMPSEKTKIKVKLNGKIEELTYNPEYRRIFGLTEFYKENKIQEKDEVVFGKKADGTYELRLQTTPQKTEETEEDLLDLSGLSSQAKGNIVEDRIKELLLLHGQGLLSIYKPVSDTEGIDLIVVRSGQFHPVFLQVKGRFGLQNDSQLILSIKVKTFNPHPNYYVIGAFFNPKTLEIEDNLLLIPSAEIANNAIKVNTKNTEWYRVVTALRDESKGKWTKYLINKADLSDKLLERFGEIEKYIK